MTPVWQANWRKQLYAAGPSMTAAQMDATARLAAVLLCGEQSAIQIFSAEVRQGRVPARALDGLRRIEHDEHLHEQALTSFCEFLPVPNDVHQLKRKAQRFFAGLGRVEDMARHFGQIAHLDAAVCKIMWHIEKSSLHGSSPLVLLAQQIKRDEARHVAVSRRYAETLNLDSATRSADAERVCAGLVRMLQPLGASFEAIGVDSDRLFHQLAKTPSP